MIVGIPASAASSAMVPDFASAILQAANALRLAFASLTSVTGTGQSSTWAFTCAAISGLVGIMICRLGILRRNFTTVSRKIGKCRANSPFRDPGIMPSKRASVAMSCSRRKAGPLPCSRCSQAIGWPTKSAFRPCFVKYGGSKGKIHKSASKSAAVFAARLGL